MTQRFATEALPPVLEFTGNAHRERGTQYSIFGIDTDGALLAYNTTTRTIVRSYNDGDNWQAFTGWMFPENLTPQHIHHLPNGEVVIGTSMTGSEFGSRIFLSSGWRIPATVTFSNTFNLRPDTYFSFGSFSAYQNIVVVSEYGKQTKNAAEEGGNPATRAFLSIDGAQTFVQIFDLATDVIEGESGAWGTTARMQHLHGVAYDPWWDRIWLIVGDGSSAGAVTATIYSDDRGITWHVAFESPWGHWQSVTPHALPAGLATGSDFDGNGVRLIPREAFRESGELEAVHIFDGGAAIRYIGMSVFEAPNGPVLFAFTGVGSPSPGGVVGTFDGGLSWFTLYKDTNTQPGEQGYKGAILCVGPTNTGRYVTVFNDTTRFPSGSVMISDLKRANPEIEFGPQSAEILVGASAMSIRQGSPQPPTADTIVAGVPAWRMPWGGTTGVAASVYIPEDWDAYDLQVVWSPVADGEAGGITFRLDSGPLRIGATWTPEGAPDVVVTTVAAYAEMIASTLRTGLTQKGRVLLNLRRYGDDGGDTKSDIFVHFIRVLRR